MRGCLSVGEGDDRSDVVAEFIVREVLGGFGGEDERSDLCACGAKNDGISDIRGGAESEFNGDRVGLFTIDLSSFELGVGMEGVTEGERTMTSVSSMRPIYLYVSGIVECFMKRSLVA